MRRLLPRVLAIGADPADGPEMRLRKALLLTAVFMFAPAGFAWGVLYVLLGAPDSAVWPWAYALIAAVSVPVLAATRRYEVFAAVQFTCFIVLPFVLMWSLGGFVSGSLVALWAMLAPLAARTIGHRRASLALSIAFFGGIVVTALIGPYLEAPAGLSETAITALFVLNALAVGAASMVLVDASAGGREGSLEAMRTLVQRYFSPDVAEAIVADPERQALGGEVMDVTVLFADLGGYTSYSSDRSPHDVVDLLNAMFAAALPAVQAEGGTPITLPGDAVMAIFGAPRSADDHPRRAALAATAIQSATERVVRQHRDWPRFRIGLNSGEALVGNIGSEDFRNFTAIGDTVNVAQRLGALAEPGQVVTAYSTAARLGDGFELAWLPEVSVKGKAEPIRPCLVVRAGG
jgi:class 3 adenylate cyclase